MPKRDQWIFTEPCGCPVGVSEGYTADHPGEAMSGMYDESAAELRSALNRGITARLITWETYDRDYYPKMSTGYQCPHKQTA